MASSSTLFAGTGLAPGQLPVIPTGPRVSVDVWRVYDLPKVREVSHPSLAGSIIHEQRHFNDGALKHPTLIYDTYWRQGELIARCLQVTSWTQGRKYGLLVQEKQDPTPGAWFMRLQYVAIDHYEPWRRSQTEPIHNMPILSTEGSHEMRNQSYVHLDHYFEIEAKHLTPFEGRGGRSVKIDGPSRAVLMYKFRKFLTGAIKRNLKCNFQSPMDVHRNQIPRINEFPHLRSLADEGERKEYARIWKSGGEYSGHESWPLKERKALPPPPGVMPSPPVPVTLPPPAPLASQPPRQHSRDSGYGSTTTSPVLNNTMEPHAPAPALAPGSIAPRRLSPPSENAGVYVPPAKRARSGSSSQSSRQYDAILASHRRATGISESRPDAWSCYQSTLF